jgi:hypothetical protein
MLNPDDDAVVRPHGSGQPVQPIDEAVRVVLGRGIGERALLHVDDDQGMFHGCDGCSAAISAAYSIPAAQDRSPHGAQRNAGIASVDERSPRRMLMTSRITRLALHPGYIELTFPCRIRRTCA